MIDRPWSGGEFGFETSTGTRSASRIPDAMLASSRAAAGSSRSGAPRFAGAARTCADGARATAIWRPGQRPRCSTSRTRRRAPGGSAKHVDFAAAGTSRRSSSTAARSRSPRSATDVFADGRSGARCATTSRCSSCTLYDGDPARGARRRLRRDRARRLRRRAAVRHRLGRRHRPAATSSAPAPAPISACAARSSACSARPSSASRSGARTPAATTSSSSRDVFARWLEFSAFCPMMEIGGHGAHAPWDDAERAALRRGADRDLPALRAAASRSDPVRAPGRARRAASAGCRSRGRWCSPIPTIRACATCGTSICTATTCWSRRCGENGARERDV